MGATPQLRIEAGKQDLTAAKASLEAEGWCVLPDVITAAESDFVLRRLWAAAEESERRGALTYMPHLDPNASNVRVFYLLELDTIFRELIQHPVAIAMVRAVLGNSFIVSNFTANIARPGAKSMALHSDQSLVMPEPWLRPSAVNIIWCLTDATFENGSTLFIPGSHRWQTKADVSSDAPRLLRPFEAKAGSIVVMEGRVWHTSGANITADQDRALLFGYYTSSYLRPQVNWNVCLSAETQATLGDQMRDWLGLGLNANVEIAGDLRHLDVQFPGAAQNVSAVQASGGRS